VKRTIVALVVLLAGCQSAEQRPHDPEFLRMKGTLTELEEDLRSGGDAVAMRCRVASLYLTLASFTGSPTDDRLDCAQRALLHADAALALDDERVEGHFYRAVGIGRVLELSTMPDLSLIGDLEAAGLRAKELDPAFCGAGPVRLLALLYWQAPAWPIGPEDAGEHEVIDALFRQSIELAPTSAENHLSYAEYLADRDREDEALEHFLRAKRLLPDDRLVNGFERPEIEARIDAGLKR
jgi:tetratricopeptide (TPR) repeat protein